MINMRSIVNVAASAYCAVAAMFVLLSVQPVQAAAPPDLVSQSPLSVGGNVPGNLLLVPSVEFPTIDSVANLGDYDPASTYVGYFDSDKCYLYHYEATEKNRHFYPNSLASSHACSGAQEWSGNYMNWVATQTIDPFRKALTGGYRVRDSATETWLEKARSGNQSSAAYFPNRVVTNDGFISGATPATWGDFRTRISRLGNKMHFSRINNVGAPDAAAVAAIPYQGLALSDNADVVVYEMSIRVKVCDAGVRLESNCVRYDSGYKPEGLIQKYSGRIRYSAFGYLNDHSENRDGGALRARQKFVGPQKLSFDLENGWVPSVNDNKEWDENTGVFATNPDPDDADATTDEIIGGSGYVAAQHAISNSGVINYINKFGQMTAKTHKNLDPVSELYYAALRYLKNQGNIASYTSLTGNALNRYEYADGFPVITAWDDPIQYACQNNAILGIGDVYTHRDKNLPGNNRTNGEPSAPSFGSDTLDVRAVMQKIWEMEFGDTNYPMPMPQGATENSPYIAALAYHARTSDLRTSLTGRQSASTYWVDVRENQRLEDRNRNQYWLAAKYGGFEVPDDFNPATATSIPNGSWESDETLSHWSTGTGSHSISRTRPANFYVASEAEEMVSSLTRAFANIVAESKGSASSLAANSTRLETETRTFQAQFFSGSWGGELNAYSVDENGQLSASAVWNATEDMLASGDTWEDRNILVNAGGSLESFEWDELTGGQQTKLVSLNEVNYLRGERANEESFLGGTLRVRDSILGDIVNSTPLFIGAPNAALHAGAAYAGGTDYVAWATNDARADRQPVVYVGANDGMLHAFNATDGREIFAFVPNTAIENGLVNYTDPDYEHQFYVDGETAAADIFDTATDSWKTVLVGSLGRGGPGIFALDVTDPTDPKLLWELDGSDIPQLGRNIGRPVIAQVGSGDWRVLLGSGPDSGAGAYLISIGLGGATNGVSTTISADTSSGNGLTALLVRDSADADVYADVAYAGDLEGGLWKFTSIGAATPPAPTLLFRAVDPDGAAQPITAAPMVGRNPETGHLWVFFGTGQFLNEIDLGDKQVQTWYGLIDDGSFIANRTELVQREILVEATVAGIPARVIEAGTAGDLSGKKGWYMDLVSPGVDGEKGERMVVQNRFQGQALIGTSRIPEFTDPCDPGGTGYIMAISPFTGARLASNFFDMDGDGVSKDADKYCDGNGNCVPVSGIGFASSPNNPIFIENVMQVGLDDGETDTITTFGSAVEAARLSWRELFNN